MKYISQALVKLTQQFVRCMSGDNKVAAWNKNYSLQIRSRLCKHTPRMQRCRQTCRHMCEEGGHVGNPGAEVGKWHDPVGKELGFYRKCKAQHSSFPYQLIDSTSRQHMWRKLHSSSTHTEHTRRGWFSQVELRFRECAATAAAHTVRQQLLHTDNKWAHKK